MAFTVLRKEIDFGPVEDREFVVNSCFDNDQDDDQRKNELNRPVQNVSGLVITFTTN